ncbi:S9 family peptidase [Shewanella sp. Scap07]|uniref:alpha/beta hydrolase family protein n=1 Tax=Shewanella sp. Scap07 TaxID=2589987 RepID=UPI0015BA024F|nr:prolyl oligopeptidase family serine peptidase [Shewanella sp. Scap07]QLE84074.1 S9 family peptidase [Shewanella sp. Scap07]
MLRIVIIVWLLSISATIQAQPLPVEAFGLLPQAEQVKLAPNGNQFAFIFHNKGNSYLGIKSLGSHDVNYILSTDNQKFKINWYVWANDEVLLVSASYPIDKMGVKYSESRLLKVIASGGEKIRTVLKLKDGEHRPQFQDTIIDILPDEPDHILMALDLKAPNQPDVYKVNINSRLKRKLIQKGRSGISYWITDQQHRLRLGYGIDDTKVFFRLYDIDSKEWHRIWEYELFDNPDITPLGFGVDPNTLYIRALHNGRYAIFTVDLAKADLPRELVYADENYDVEGSLIYSKKTKEVIGVRHGEAANGKVFFDEKYARFQQALNKAIPDAYNNIMSLSADGNRYILYTSNPRSPGAFYLGDRKAKSLDYILDEYPLLVDQPLSDKQKVVFKARDGLELEAYVTLPPSNVKAKQSALVIPHGGPMARNYSGFNWFSQFFASRGYTVIEPNFRGSSGYGFEFQMASIQQWGGAMQHDLADAAFWLAEHYPIDKDKICILGISYGGYAAMQAAVTQQQPFKCAASFAGVSDLEHIIRKARKFTNYKVVKKQLGDDSDKLEQQSPVNFAKQVNIPMLLIHGDKDRIVDVYHSREMFDELTDYDKDVEYLELENGNHHLEIEQNRMATLKAFEAFLSKHL